MLPNRVHSGIERIQGLLGAQAVQQFCLMSVNINIDNIMLVSGDASDMTNVLVDYKDVFKGEGRLEEMLHLIFDKTVLPESGFLTTFGTPWGRYRRTRMPFGISPAPEEFQQCLNTALGGLQGIVPIYDDIFISGVGETKAEAIKNREQHLLALLERCRNKGIKLNKEKCKFHLSEVYGPCHI